MNKEQIEKDIEDLEAKLEEMKRKLKGHEKWRAGKNGFYKKIGVFYHGPTIEREGECRYGSDDSTLEHNNYFKPEHESTIRNYIDNQLNVDLAVLKYATDNFAPEELVWKDGVRQWCLSKGYEFFVEECGSYAFPCYGNVWFPTMKAAEGCLEFLKSEGLA